MEYTEEQIKFIMSKIPDIKWEDIPNELKQFWVNYKNVK